MNRTLAAAFIVSISVHALLLMPGHSGPSVGKTGPMEINMGNLQVVQVKAENKRPEIGARKAPLPKSLSSGGSGTDNRGSYLSEIRRRIMESRRYPEIARVKGFEGESQVEFIISREGEVEKVSLIRSSNYECLDKEVMEAVKRASPFPPIPKAFCSSKIKVAVPVIFRLEEKS